MPRGLRLGQLPSWRGASARGHGSPASRPVWSHTDGDEVFSDGLPDPKGNKLGEIQGCFWMLFWLQPKPQAVITIRFPEKSHQDWAQFRYFKTYKPMWLMVGLNVSGLSLPHLGRKFWPSTLKNRMTRFSQPLTKMHFQGFQYVL